MSKKILVHICCSVDSHYFLQKMQTEYQDSKLIGFFYDPNIHPYSEYYLRLLDVKRSCKILDIELIEGEYDYINWIEATRGLENEPEKGARCSICFDRRFYISAKMAKDIGATHFTSTLLTSPKKSLKQLKSSGDALAKEFNIEFLAPDYRSNSGTQEQNIIAKKDKLYRQNYCGCLYGLKQQRESQDRLLDELRSPISNQLLPNSIEDKIRLYKRREELESLNIDYEIVKHRFLNYRVTRALVKSKKESLISHILPYSTIRNNYSRGRVEKELYGIYYFNRDEIKFITLKFYNELANTNYKSILELIDNPPIFNEEIKIREKITKSPCDLSAIFVLDCIEFQKYEINLYAKAYEDVKEEIVQIEPK